MTILGLIAGALTTLSFLPQVIRTLRTRHAGDLSAAWLLIFGTGVAAWCVYGILRSDVAIIVTNAATFTLVMALVIAKYAVGTAPRPSGDDARRAAQVSG
jgi:MtN3 and saliva related transmembrane protein